MVMFPVLNDVNIQTHFQLTKHIVFLKMSKDLSVKYERKNMSAKCGNHLMDSSYRDGEKIFDFCVRANFFEKKRQNRHLYNYSSVFYFVTVMFVLSFVLTSLFSLFYATRVGDRFLHRG